MRAWSFCCQMQFAVHVLGALLWNVIGNYEHYLCGWSKQCSHRQKSSMIGIEGELVRGELYIHRETRDVYEFYQRNGCHYLRMNRGKEQEWIVTIIIIITIISCNSNIIHVDLYKIKAHTTVNILFQCVLGQWECKWTLPVFVCPSQQWRYITVFSRWGWSHGNSTHFPHKTLQCRKCTTICQQ